MLMCVGTGQERGTLASVLNRLNEQKNVLGSSFGEKLGICSEGQNVLTASSVPGASERQKRQADNFLWDKLT